MRNRDAVSQLDELPLSQLASLSLLTACGGGGGVRNGETGTEHEELITKDMGESRYSGIPGFRNRWNLLMFQ
jgi:hypothetical protein